MKIYKECPLTIWIISILTFLVAAFIICGGEIEISAAPPRIRIRGYEAIRMACYIATDVRLHFTPSKLVHFLRKLLYEIQLPH